MHGSADHDGTGSVSVPLEAYGENLLPGVTVRYPSGEADRGEAGGRNPSYAFFQNVSRGEVTDGVVTTFAVAGSPVGVRTHLFGGADAEAFLGDAISFRRAEENDALLDRFRMPIFLLRSRGPAPLTSRFAAVHEPYLGAPFVDEASLTRPEENGEAIALVVRHHGVTDHIVHCAQPRQVTAGDLELNGTVGFVREREGVLLWMGLWGGEALSWRGHTLRADGVYDLEVTGTAQTSSGHDALIVSGEIPEGDALMGATAVVTFGDDTTQGYPVRKVVQAGTETRVALEIEVGFAVENGTTKHLFFPLREIPGPVTCRIRGSASVVLKSEGQAEVTSVGGATYSAP
jgi:hypothetical protein